MNTNSLAIPKYQQPVWFYDPIRTHSLLVSIWLVVWTILKNISQWKGLFYILRKIKKRFQTTNQLFISVIHCDHSWSISKPPGYIRVLRPACQKGVIARGAVVDGRLKDDRTRILQQQQQAASSAPRIAQESKGWSMAMTQELKKLEVPTVYKAYFLSLCKGISPQNIAWKMVYTNVPSF